MWNDLERNPFFTGHEELLPLLHTYFASGPDLHTRIQALYGLAGIGKTQIALEYAHRYQQDYQTIFWIRASSLEIFHTDVQALADLLLLSENERTNEEQLFLSIRRSLQYHEGWLLFFDDLEDFRLIDPLIPSQCKGRVLLTTRVRLQGTSLHTVQFLP